MAIVREMLKTGKRVSANNKNKFMRKLFIISMLFLSGSAFAQSNRNSTDVTGGIPPCADNLCPSLDISLSLANLHKPRTGCSSGFGLCLKLSVSVNCNPCSGKGKIVGDKVNIYTKINNDYAEMHIPVDLKYQKGFEKTDFSIFELEDKSVSFKLSNGIEKLARGGIYPVEFIGDEYVVKINFY